MQRENIPGARRYSKRNRQRRIWHRIVGVMACVVVFCTTYALILPAITQERETFCGFEAHTHEDSCYTRISQSASTVLTCALENPDSTVVHSHDARCYGAEGNLICTLPEISTHIHDDSCYAKTGHTHDDSCYTTVRGELTCTLAEEEGHAHGEGCYTAGENYACGLEETEGHIHGDSCYTVTEVIACGLAESAGHSHTDACYTVTDTLACGLEESEDHAHTAECYVQDRSLTCGQEETEAHTHDESCKAQEKTLSCGLAEVSPHAHSESCLEQILTCEMEESEGHTHMDACYEQIQQLTCTLEEMPESEPELVCTLAEIKLHTHGIDCADAAACTEPQVIAHVHSDSCFTTTEASEDIDTLTCGLEESEEHQHSQRCYGTWELTCELEEHEHDLSCYSNPEADLETAADWEATFADAELTGIWQEDVLIIAKTQLGYTESTSNYVVWEDGTTHGYTRYGEWYGIPCGDWCGMFVSFCLHYAGVEDMPLNYGVRPWIEDLTALGLYHTAEEYDPKPGNLVFFDWEGDGLSDHVGLVAEIIEATEETPAQLKTIEGNSGNKVQYVTYDLDDAALLGYSELPEQLSEEELAAVDYVIQLIDEMPSADEIDAKIAEFEEAEDYDGEEAWLTEVYQQVAKAYYYYDQLSNAQKSRVTNADKLLELEYIWSVTEYTASAGTGVIDTLAVWQVNAYSSQSTTYESVLIYGGSYDSVVGGSATFGSGWEAIVVSTDSNGYLYIENYVTDSSDKSALKPSDTKNGFVFYATAWYLDSRTYWNNGTKIYVSINIDYKSMGKGAYTGTAYGTITFDNEVFPKKTATESDSPTPLQSAHTSEFIELNLYDYGSNINTNFKNNKYSYTDWNGATKYTSYYPGFQWNGGAYVKADLVDSTSGTADRNHIDSIDFGNSLITDLKYSGSSHAKSTTATDITFFSDSGTYSINAMDYYYKDSNYAVYGVNNRPIGLSIGSSITDTSYDVLMRTLGSDGYPVIKANGTSLAYLFTNNTYATKKNTTSIDGLFLQDSTTGEYYFNSRWNHAQYSNNRFTLYNQIITPNFITYPFGNFMPFNDITNSEASTQVSKITSMGNYMDYMIDQLYPYTKSSYTAGFDSSRDQLYYMLNQYKSNVEYYGIHSKSWSTFSASDAIWDYFTGGGANEGDSPSSNTGFLTDNLLSKMYNIDYDVEKNFFFGMEMKMNFYQPKDGLTGNDNDGDGTPNYNMEFYFTGDDDVWVYIDNVLFLDLTGIHRHVGGKIDFVNGKVYYYALDISTGDVSSKPYATYTFEEILEAAGASTADLNDKGTFKDYTTHSFNFYYMERGSGSSVCRLNFNFPLLRQNSLAVEKELADDDSTAAVEALGNPDFLFQVLDADDDRLFLPEGWAYSLYDTDGSVIQEITVNESYDDGRVKSMVIKDGSGNILCKETYDSNGNMNGRTGDGQDKVLRIGENGVFALKAGQKAEFVGIPETWGKYYVRELLEGTVAEQYGTITVSGTAVTPETVSVGGVSYSGVKSPVLDMTNGSSTFRIENKITTSKLGKLSITKKLDATYSGNTDKTFQFSVMLDGKPLPDGTTYDIVDVNGNTVSEDNPVIVVKDDAGNVTASYVEIAPGQTATISGILAGTIFEVTETAESAKGYTVTYSVDGDVKASDSAAGTIGVNTTAAVSATNSEIGTSVEIPIAKTMSYFGNASRSYQFTIEQVADQNGTALGEGSEKYTFTTEPLAEPTTDYTKYTFTVNYTTEDVSSGETKTYYYKIFEVEGTAAVRYDTKYYIVKVDVTNTNDVMSAKVTDVWLVDGEKTEHKALKDGETLPDTHILFTNTILTNLSISKTVVGTNDDRTNRSYTFTLKLDKYESNADLPTKLVGTKNLADGTTEDVSYALDENGEVTFELKHGETVKFTNIPYRSQWTLTEASIGGFVTTYTITANNATNEYTGNVISEQLASAANITVVCTNTRTYTLPDTGGTGTYLYTTGGILLIALACLLLLYSKKSKCRKGDASF